MVEKIKKLCEEHGTNIYQLEKKANLQKGYIYKWNTVSPSVDKVKAVADALGEPIEKLLP